jgi:hypothetical protein
MWSFDKENKVFQVQGFGQLLQCAPPVDPEAMKKQQEEENKGVYAFLFGKDSRAGPSGADPSALAKEPINTEEDVLHVPTLPTFGGKLNQSASELLIQYLTVPYLRIPLLLNLLATPEHISSLGNREIQGVLDGALYEPGKAALFIPHIKASTAHSSGDSRSCFSFPLLFWHLALWQTPSDQKTVPTVVPAPERSIFATPCGLLFNELQKSPHGMMRALSDLLEYAVELDTGSYNHGTANIILYVVRLIVRIESFMIFLMAHHQWDDKPPVVNGTGHAAFIRGLDITPVQFKLLSDKRKQLREILNEQVFPMIDRWYNILFIHFR